MSGLQLRAAVCGSVLALAAASFAAELHFGSPAPEFSATALRGEPIESLEADRIYVIEFGGTQCAPCIKFIPEMNALQEKHPAVVFVSVFSESPDAVTPFLEGPGKAMRVRVATDESFRMQREWLQAGGLIGIPQAFIVDRSGRVAWFGNPTERFGEILRAVVDGQYDGRLEHMRMELQRKTQALERLDSDWIKRINDLRQRAYRCDTPRESIELIDKALPEFAGSPERIRVSIMKLRFYRQLPESRAEAYRHALSLAVEAVRERNPYAYLEACGAMLGHCEHALPENVDNRLADLALVVLLDETAPTHHVEVGADTAIDIRAKRHALLADAHRIRGDLPAAQEQLSEAIAILRDRARDGKPEWWLNEQREWRERLESRLADWNKSETANDP